MNKGYILTPRMLEDMLAARRQDLLPKVKIQTARETRVWNFFMKQDEFWAINEWPGWLQEIALKEHKRYNERYRFFLFLTFNGLSPLAARMWVVMKDFKDGRFIEGDYDRSAWSQLDQQVKDAFTGKLYIKHYPIMDMLTGKAE